MVTDCRIMDIVEAVRIFPHARASETAESGLLLRTDIHTLFDLDLIGIEPDVLLVRIHPMLHADSYGALDGRPLLRGECMPSRSALESRWGAFSRRLVAP